MAGLGLPVATAAPPGESVAIEVVSSRADAVSGGDARVRVQVPEGVDAGAVQLTLNGTDVTGDLSVTDGDLEGVIEGMRPEGASVLRASGDRKSTRLNSSHVAISYAVFCLKKKKKNDSSKIVSMERTDYKGP